MLNQYLSAIAASLQEWSWPNLEARDGLRLVVLIVFVLLVLWEAGAACRRARARVTRQSYLSNLAVMLANDTVLSLLAVSSLWHLADRYGQAGLLEGVENPVVKAALALLVLDLALYGWHWACHHCDWLWRFHRVHHSDVTMNVSTAFRLHIVELLLTTLLKAVTVVVFGINSALLLLSETLLTLLVMFHHANVRFGAESTLGRVFIVPALHRVHHSRLREEHDSNYGAAFSFWDRLFGTLREAEPVALGLRGVGEQSWWETVRYGFSPLAPSLAPQLHVMIAEAAYFRAEKRGFEPGWEVSDWIEAEREILTQSGHRKHRQRAGAGRSGKLQWCLLPR